MSTISDYPHYQGGPLLGWAGRHSAASAPALYMWGSGKVPREEQELQKHAVSIIQTSDQQSAHHSRGLDLPKGSLPCGKQDVSQSILLSTCRLGLAQVPQILQQGHTREYILSVLTWGCEILWTKSYLRVSLPTGSCLVCGEACGLSCPSWDKLYSLTSRVVFTQ